MYTTSHDEGPTTILAYNSVLHTAPVAFSIFLTLTCTSKWQIFNIQPTI